MNPVPTKKQERYLKRIQAYITRMPSLSTTAIKVLESCNDSNASANDLHRVISFDPVLTARVLKLINSAYYSLGVPITSLARAIVMLGVNTVKNLALSFAILENLRSNGHFSVFSPDDFWMHSLCVGRKHVIPKSPLTDLVSCPLFARCHISPCISSQSAAPVAGAHFVLPKISFISMGYVLVKFCAICW
mgnify:CR=1 FL=1